MPPKESCCRNQRNNEKSKKENKQTNRQTKKQTSITWRKETFTQKIQIIWLENMRSLCLTFYFFSTYSLVENIWRAILISLHSKKKKKIVDVSLLKKAVDIHTPEPIETSLNRLYSKEAFCRCLLSQHGWKYKYRPAPNCWNWRKNPRILNICLSLFPVSLIGLYSKVKSASPRQTFVTREREILMVEIKPLPAT